MNDSENVNYDRIAKAINFIKENFKEQPGLERVADEVNLSPFHFQKLFTEWAGISPKKFLQYISIEHAKNLLKESRTTLFAAAYETGLSGTSRLHDLFIQIESMTPAEYKNGGRDLVVNYSFNKSPFGNVIIASTQKGVCHIAFYEEEDAAFSLLKKQLPNSVYRKNRDLIHLDALSVFQNDWTKPHQIKLHLRGTDFQLKVWQALLKIPMGTLTTYKTIADRVEKPAASRAVGTAIGANPVAFLIPCHRVIQGSGNLGGYMWGTTRKSAIIGWESAKVRLNHV